jgi:hypothetical protein
LRRRRYALAGSLPAELKNALPKHGGSAALQKTRVAAAMQNSALLLPEAASAAQC